ncbi:MAG: hypothetical protein C0609_02050 [Deltaproteobacteria bacterium]|nr:MAG: hypothetical protein C0609_02050 [Deltaproteobacteria bacterium]
MPYRGDPRNLFLARAGLFVALAATLQAVESLIPSPAPWLRLGLGNALVLAALILWGFRGGFLVATGKVLLGSLIAGRLISHLFLFSLSGTYSSLFMMALAMALLPRMGYVGLSTLGAVAHSLAGLAVASVILMGPAVWSLAVAVLPAAVLSGAVTGVAAWYLVKLSGGRVKALPVEGEDIRG